MGDRTIRSSKIDTPVGSMEAFVQEDTLIYLALPEENGAAERVVRMFGGGVVAGESACATELSRQLREYFAGNRICFDVPYRLMGTEFAQRVWREMSKIPYGSVVTYKQLAAAAGRPGASRACGSACAKNRLPIILPCHRVVGSDGSLTGYAGGLELKRSLLELEQGRE